MRPAAVTVALFLLVGSRAPAAEPEAFGLTKVHQLHVTVAAKDYKAMDPPPANPFAQKPGSGRPAPGSPDAGAGNFNFEFEYVRADLVADGQAMKDVGLRYKGSGTYFMSQRNAKRSFKIDIDRYGGKGTFHGVTKLNLNSSVIDPTKGREALAYFVYRAAGVPAPRTAFADVSLTVPGKYDREYLGIYTAVEQVDKAFLKANFKNAKGMLLKPEGIRGLPYLGSEKAAFEASYNAKIDGDEASWKRLMELTRLVNKADPVEFRAEIGKYLDTDNCVRFLAATALLSSMDSFIGLGHNYYLYLSPETQKFAFIPWDLDLAFGGFAMFGTQDQLANLSIDHPHLGDNKLIDRLFAIPALKAAYQEQIKHLHADLFASGRLAREAEAVEAAIKDSVAREKKAVTGRKEDFGGGVNNPFSPPPVPLKTLVEKRSAAVAAQLTGKGTGYVPNFGQPPPPPANGPAQQLAKPLLQALDANKDGKVSEEEFQAGMRRLFAEWDKDKSGTLDQKKIADGLQKLMLPPGRP